MSFLPVALNVGGTLSSYFMKQATRSGLKQGASTFISALPFGAGYSFGTYVGFPKNYQKKSKYSQSSNVELIMPYGYYPRRRYSRYSRYSRYGSRSSRRYRRSYPRRFY